jgi:hypothetical protein
MDCLVQFRLMFAISFIVMTTGCHVGGCKIVQIPAPAQISTPLVDVTGSVKMPTAVPIDPAGLKLWSAIIRAGGAVASTENETGRMFVTLHRANCEYHFALSLVEGEFAGEIQLAPGDIIRVNPFADLLKTRAFLAESAAISEFAHEADLERGFPTLISWEDNAAQGRLKADFSQSGATLQDVEPSKPPAVGSSKTSAAGSSETLDEPKLGACDAIAAPQEAGPAMQNSAPSPVVLDADGNAAMVLVISRDGTTHQTDRELFVVPSSLLADSMDSSRFDSTILSDFRLRRGDTVAAANLEQIPIIASSLLAPHIKAEQLRLRNLALQRSRTPQVPFAGVPVIGTVSDCVCRLKRNCKTVTVETYEAPATHPAISGLNVPYVSAQDSVELTARPEHRCQN